MKTLNNWLKGRDSDRAAFATVDRVLPPLTTKAIPMTVLLDAQGNVNRKLTGAWKWDDPSVVEHIKALAR